LDRTGARVWIRDSGLAQGSTGAIVSSLAADLAAAGLRLRALTVNGRTASIGAEAGSGKSKSYQDWAAGPVKTSRSTFSDEVNRHGNDWIPRLQHSTSPRLRPAGFS